MKKTLSLFLALLIASVPALLAHAQSIDPVLESVREGAQADALEEARLILGEKYGINITCEVDINGDAVINAGSLATLDAALDNVTPQVVKQISRYWKRKTGEKLTYAFRYSPYAAMDFKYEILGCFDSGSALIEIYIPVKGSDALTTGESPINMLHELGHAYHQMLMGLCGEEKLKEEWASLNGKAGYTSGIAADEFEPKVFASAYAATSYEEDFAEVFAHAFVRNKAGQGFSHNLLDGEEKTPLGNKLDYIENTFTAYITNTVAAVKNFRRAYNAPACLEYRGQILSGDYLQFIGYNYPRNVYGGVLKQTGLEAQSSAWIAGLGGWRVTSVSGESYILFPGGFWVDMK